MKKGVKVSSSYSSRLFFWILIAAVVVYVFQAIFIFGTSFQYYRHAIANIFIVILALLALFSTIFIYRKISQNFPREKEGKLFLIISIFLFFLGDLLWLIAEAVFDKVTPLGSYPDLAWSLAYVALIISLVYFISVGFRPSSRLIYLLVVTGLVIGGVILFNDVSEDIREGNVGFSHFIQDSYILYDVIVLLLIIYLVWPILFEGSQYGWHWVILGGGMLTRLVYDQIFANMSQNNTYYAGHPIDLLYTFFYVSVALAFYIKSKDFVRGDDD
ncbi:Uncharacterised protein [uncultured archaeon]|nr:Uncharacterised protein [uncultured archaeon]